MPAWGGEGAGGMGSVVDRGGLDGAVLRGGTNGGAWKVGNPRPAPEGGWLGVVAKRLVMRGWWCEAILGWWCQVRVVLRVDL